jgi:hypothetical protein
MDGSKADIVYNWTHIGHDPYSRLGLQNAKIPRGLRLWVKDCGGRGMSATQLAAIVRVVTRYCSEVGVAMIIHHNGR